MPDCRACTGVAIRELQDKVADYIRTHSFRTYVCDVTFGPSASAPNGKKGVSFVNPELSSTPGLIDFVWDAARVSMTPIQSDFPSTMAGFPSLEDYVVGFDWDFHNGGSIAFVLAGRQDENYPQRVITFN